MFGIGASEIVVIALVVLIFIRPDDLPLFFRSLGRLYAQAKKAYNEVAAIKDDFLREMEVTAAIQDAEQSRSEPAAKRPVEPPAAEPKESPGGDAAGTRP
jgi:sec-independent protein translocase protein TatB